MRDTDQYQLALARSGDKNAFGDLAINQGPALYNYLLRMLKGRREEAEDISQETLLRAYRSISTFRGQSRLRTWLRRIANNLAINHLQRKKLPAQSLTGEEDQPQSLDIPDLSFAPEKEIEHGCARQQAREALSSLPEGLRVVFVLREFEGYSHKEIAGRLGLNAQAVRVRYHRARQLLSRRLQIPVGESP